MSGVLHPIGPEPPMVYWIRRGAVVVLVVAVLIAGWWLIGSLRGGSDSATGGDPVVAESSSPSGSADPEPSASSEGSPAATSDEPLECGDADIKVEATTDSSTYPVGSTPRLTLTITNTGDVACTRDVGPKANELTITSGGYHVWSSDDCNASNKTKVTTLKPGEPVASSITWDGHLSSAGCPDGEGAAAKAGRYDLVGRNGKVDSASTPFALTSAE